MNPIFLSSLAAFFHKIKCPKCGKYQYVTHGTSQKPFRCKFCSYLIEPSIKK